MAEILKTNGGLVIDRPGNVLFVPIKADGTEDWANSIRNTAKINTITVTNSKTSTDIPDGNSFYAAGSRITAIAGTVAVDFSTVDPAVWAMASGSELTKTTTDTQIKLYDYEKIGEDNKITVNDKYKADSFVKVLCSDGTEFEKVTGESATPKTGEYSVSVDEGGKTTTFTFAVEDKNKSVAISMMTETPTISYSQGRKAMKYHKIIIDTEYSTLNDSQKIPVNIIISQASVTGDMADALQKDPSATKTLTFNMYAPLPGEEPYTLKFKDTDAN